LRTLSLGYKAFDTFVVLFGRQQGVWKFSELLENCGC